MDNERRIAVLIDADNVSPKYIKCILDEIVTHGVATYKRIYGDWTKPQLGPWKDTLLEYSITPIQQYGYTTGKNATDSALIIDAMDILYSHNVDGFCIVSSDSDFTKLASRLREAGMFVLGIGEKKTPRPFIVACEKFKYMESLLAASEAPDPDTDVPEEDSPESGAPKKQHAASSSDFKKLIRSIKGIINEVSDEDGWAYMGDVGNLLNKRYPDFDTRNYGFNKLTPLVSSLKVFEIDNRKTSNPHIVHKYIRFKQNREQKKFTEPVSGSSKIKCQKNNWNN